MTLAIGLLCIFGALMSVTGGQEPLIEDRWGLRVIVGTVTVLVCLVAFAPVSWTWF